MKKTIIIILTFIIFVHYANGQDCLKKDFYSSIDTTNRPVFKFVEKMPEILNGKFFMKTINQSQLFDSLQCCPFKVWIGLVVETDSTLTNIQVCTKMIFCKDEDDEFIATETKKFNNKMTELLSNIKSIPGELNGEKVAVFCLIPIHLDCR